MTPTLSWPAGRPWADRPPWSRALGPISHLRIGSSSCPRRLPSRAELGALLDRAQRDGRGVELATAVCGDEALDRVDALLAAAAGGPLELVANDWGVLSMARREHPQIPIIAGRLLNRQMKDPRLADVAPTRLGGAASPAAMPAAWRGAAAGTTAWRALATRMGIGRVELDWPAPGFDRGSWTAAGWTCSLHLPWVLVAAGRTCVERDPGGALDRARTGLDCERTCLAGGRPLRLEGAGRGAELRRVGNAEWSRLSPEAIDAASSWVRRGASADPDGADGRPDRVVIGALP